MYYRLKSGPAAYVVFNGTTDEFNNSSEVTVDDVIFKRKYCVPKKDLKPVKGAYPNECDRYMADQLKKAIAVSKAAEGIVGKIFRTHVGEGHAYYVVVGETDKRAIVEWRGFGPERYVDRYFKYGGSFSKDKVRGLVNYYSSMRQIFEGV